MPRRKATENLVRLSLLAALAAVLTAVPQDGVACDRCGAHYPPPPVASALDMPLTWYFMPRRPGCPEHGFRYRVKTPELRMAGRSSCEPDDCDTRSAESFVLSPELTDGFAPIGFERLGQIPNHALLDASAASR